MGDSGLTSKFLAPFGRLCHCPILGEYSADSDPHVDSDVPREAAMRTEKHPCDTYLSLLGLTLAASLSVSASDWPPQPEPATEKSAPQRIFEEKAAAGIFDVKAAENYIAYDKEMRMRNPIVRAEGTNICHYTDLNKGPALDLEILELKFDHIRAELAIGKMNPKERGKWIYQYDRNVERISKIIAEHGSDSLGGDDMGYLVATGAKTLEEISEFQKP